MFLNLAFRSSVAAAAKLCKAAHIRSLLPYVTHQIPPSQRQWDKGNPKPDLWKSLSQAACQSFRFHTLPTLTLTGTFAPSWNVPRSRLRCLFLGLWSRSCGSSCSGSVLRWNGETWERPACSGGCTIFLPATSSVQLSLPPADTSESSDRLSWRKRGSHVSDFLQDALN